MIEEQATRVEGMEAVDLHSVCYWKDENGWWVYLPRCGSGRISNHTVEEHPNGTITASPSILMTGHDKGEPMQRHGYLTKGVWREC